MNTALAVVVSVVLGYVLGGVPFAHLIARMRGVDITKIGTGNPGAANVARSVGLAYGVLVLLADVGKATLAVWVGRWMGLSAGVALAVGVAAVVGHCYSPFLRLRGGAGLAPAVGVGLGTLPLLASIGIPVALVLILWRRNVGVAAGVGYAAAFVAGLALHQSPWLMLGVIGISVAVMVRSFLRDLQARGRFRFPPTLAFLKRL